MIMIIALTFVSVSSLAGTEEKGLTYSPKQGFVSSAAYTYVYTKDKGMCILQI